jgi:hypothetical protein
VHRAQAAIAKFDFEESKWKLLKHSISEMFEAFHGEARVTQ